MLLFLNVLQTILLFLLTAGAAYLIFFRPVVAAPPPQGTRKSLGSRRREIYGDVQRVLTLLGKKGELRKEELLEFRSRTRDASLIFDTDIAAYIDEIYTRCAKLIGASEILKGTQLPVGEQRDDLTVEHAKQTIWLADQLPMLEKRFRNYPDIK